MSKYIKLEDAINTIEDKIAEYIPVLYGRYCEMPLEIRMAIEHLPTIEVVFCEECKYAPYCEQRLVKELFGDEIAEWREVDFCQHGERIEE